ALQNSPRGARTAPPCETRPAAQDPLRVLGPASGAEAQRADEGRTGSHAARHQQFLATRCQARKPWPKDRNHESPDNVAASASKPPPRPRNRPAQREGRRPWSTPFDARGAQEVISCSPTWRRNPHTRSKTQQAASSCRTSCTAEHP